MPRRGVKAEYDRAPALACKIGRRVRLVQRFSVVRLGFGQIHDVDGLVRLVRLDDAVAILPRGVCRDEPTVRYELRFAELACRDL